MKKMAELDLYLFNEGKLKEVKSLYKNSAFFRTLIGNSMMSLTKSFFELTEYMRKDKEFGDFWKIIFDEYQLTKSLLLKISGYKELMENEQAGKASIQIREKIVLPLLTIQQYALLNIQNLKESGAEDKELEVYEKMVTDGESAINQIFNALKADVPDKALSIPSIKMGARQ